MKKIFTREDLINLKFYVCLPYSMFDEDELEKDRIVEHNGKKYYNLTDPPDLVNLSHGTIKYDSDWYDDFLLIEK